MNEELRQTDGESEPQAPQRLREDLRALYRDELHVPAETDRAIVGLAHAHFARRRRLKLLMRWGGGLAGIGAAAAVIVLALRLAGPSAAPVPPVVSSPAAAEQRQDINADGVVDVLDAFALARRIEGQGVMGKEFDFNFDGAVNRKDADAIAMSAVRLDKGGVQ